MKFKHKFKEIMERKRTSGDEEYYHESDWNCLSHSQSDSACKKCPNNYYEYIDYYDPEVYYNIDSFDEEKYLNPQLDETGIYNLKNKHYYKINKLSRN